MKRTLLFALIGLLLVGMSAYAGTEGTANATSDEALPEGQARATIPVTGMTCGACCVSVEKAVKKMEGVVAVKADYEKGQATVTYEKDKIALEKIIAAINEKTSFKASKPAKSTT